MIGFRTTLRLAAGIAVFGVSFAHAQATPDSAARSIHLRLGGGTDLSTGVHAASSNFLLGADWQRPDSRLSARFDLTYSRRSRNYAAGYAAFDEVCLTNYCVRSTLTQAVGASFDGRFDLTKGRLRPYVFSGLGLYRTFSDIRSNAYCGDFTFQCSMTPGQFHNNRQTDWSIGLHSGAGLSWKAGGTQLFFETRLQSWVNGSTRLDSKTPLTFGIRF
jgi:hypothetical protein